MQQSGYCTQLLLGEGGLWAETGLGDSPYSESQSPEDPGAAEFEFLFIIHVQHMLANPLDYSARISFDGKGPCNTTIPQCEILGKSKRI